MPVSLTAKDISPYAGSAPTPVLNADVHRVVNERDTAHNYVIISGWRRFMAFAIKQGDTSPSLEATLVGLNGRNVGLSGATVRFLMRKLGASATTIDASASITSNSGVVQYDWQTGDTDETGTYQAEFEVTFADGHVETFPNNGYIRVDIVDDIA